MDHPTLNHDSAKRLWNVLRIAFFMVRKGLISKRKMLMDTHLMMKRGKVCGKSLGNLMFHHHSKAHHHENSHGLREYEFSCSNTPVNPVFHIPRRKFHLHMPHFLCIHPPSIDEDKEEDPNVIVFPKFMDCHGEYFTKDCLDQKLSPLLSPFSRRISIYSEDGDNDHQVDRKAEEFIARFYEQQRMQQVSMVQEMLARGAS